MNPVGATLSRGATLLSLCGLAACSILGHNQEAQVVVNQRIVGMSVGDFFQTYGSPQDRSEQLDGTTSYAWVSKTGKVAAGPGWLDERTCSLRIVADKRGRVASADIVLDNPGRTSTSRCGEMFSAK